MAKKKSEQQPSRSAQKGAERKAAPPEVAEEDAPESSRDEDAEEERGEGEEVEGSEGSEAEGLREGDDLLVAAREGKLGAAGDALVKKLDGDAEGAEGEEGEEDGAAPAQLGAERYVLAGFFAAGMLGAYILGKFIHGVWDYLANKDWFSQALPRVASVGDDEKTTISLVIGGIAALILVLRTYRKPDVRTWTDDVAGELTKVKWPTKKEVYNSTVVVIAASAIATIYLAMLDRLWGFITNLIYGDGS
jgi:preprotein translocase subunit SecE